MTEVRFYHLQHQSQEQVLPLLLGKALERGHKIVLKCANTQECEYLNQHLWTYSKESFLPHGSAANGDAVLQPIWITAEDENPNAADVLIVSENAVSQAQGEYALCCEMLSGHNPNAVAAARQRWKAYKEQGFEVTYWQQNENGGWEKKA